MNTLTHEDRVAAEIEIFRKQVNIHELPDIFHYWSNKYLGPFLAQAFGVPNNIEIFANELKTSIAATGNPEIISVGAGDGWVEIAIAKQLVSSGFGDFHFQCLELSPHLIERGRAAAIDAEIADKISFYETDLTDWRSSAPFGAAFAHHSLHHIIALEHVFDQIKTNLAPRGSFVTADMIGRNGHMRWPETLEVINCIWAKLDDRYKYNHQHARKIDPYENWDCSGESFEGIRAQDILPLLLERFQFHKFSAWGGLTDQFIDRGYGHNFDAESAIDRQIIDDLWAADRALVRLGATTPTQVFAVMKNEPGPLISSDGLDPKRCVRKP